MKMTNFFNFKKISKRKLKKEEKYLEDLNEFKTFNSLNFKLKFSNYFL